MPKASTKKITAICLHKSDCAKIKEGYPWVFIDWIASPSLVVTCEMGEVVHVCDHRGNFLATGMIEADSPLSIRIFSHHEIKVLDAAYFEAAFRKCLAIREKLYKEPYYRLVNSEGDNLPGLIIDRFDDLISIQITTHSMHEYRDFILTGMTTLFDPKGIYMRIIPRDERVSIGKVKLNCDVFENSVNYVANLITGQKTGWYYDQRDNRKLVASYAKGRTVLDAFCYSGGFGIYCILEGAKEVTFVDSSATAITMVKTIATLNRLTEKAKFIADDVFERLTSFAKENKAFDLVILDPPPFIKQKSQKAVGIQGYHRLALLGFKVLNPKGLMFFSTCSHHMSKRDLLQQLKLAADKLKIKIKVITTTGHAGDHPVHPHLPESHYLNSVLLQRID